MVNGASAAVFGYTAAYLVPTLFKSSMSLLELCHIIQYEKVLQVFDMDR